MLFKLVDWGTPIISLFFILLFMPISLFVYYNVKPKFREIMLIAISLAFLLMVVPRQVILIIPSIMANYAICWFIADDKEEKSIFRLVLIIINVVFNIAWWLFFAFTTNFNGYPYLLGGAVLPFLLTDVNLHVYKRKTDIPEVGKYILHAVFFPRLFAGPFGSIEEFYKNDLSAANFETAFKKGIGVFAKGAVQFAFLGARLVKFALEISKLDVDSMTKFSSWWIVIMLVLGVYHTFMGVSAAAQGIGIMYGLNISNGWQYPYSETSIIGFARKFNGSLENLLWKNMYVWSLKGVAGIVLKCAAVIVIGAVIGLWMDFSIHFMAFGIVFALVAILETFVLKRKLLKLPEWLRRVYTLSIVVLSFAIMANGITGGQNELLKSLVSLNVLTVNNQAAYYINDTAGLMILGILFTSKLFVKLLNAAAQKFPRFSDKMKTVTDVFLIVLLITLIV